MDWRAPGTGVLRRLHDGRVRQFWDPNHVLAALVKKAETENKLHPNCCERKGIPWDVTAAFAPGERWGDHLPEPVLLNGPVATTASDLDAAVAKTK